MQIQYESQVVIHLSNVQVLRVALSPARIGKGVRIGLMLSGSISIQIAYFYGSSTT